mmetsp:Transcript_26148/g.36427  ORF Transcript_26148/g.36427 Transcript_26148/m.36427 type:complete len:194 (-) Transcript_26148:163-744(-)|eukprot:CAMPEP_0184489468 /NCGR_PEP_ID=MMETSP0113_2-20130426/15521_1 /TAXON_ID=91329 /ORGANISM="Norrisiella sphaerica, Strain BC52" /LENGTH=193 /DNA_ID=CAMNT_0026872899 /DNA_START=83 /DNA_END=664 /DNA_ORIENTATION=-
MEVAAAAVFLLLSLSPVASTRAQRRNPGAITLPRFRGGQLLRRSPSSQPFPPRELKTRCSEPKACTREERQMLEKAFDETNPACKLDVDKDGLISSRDVVRVTLKAVAYNRVSAIVDNPSIGLISASVICIGALVEAFEAVAEKGVNKSAIGLAILAMGHFMHYFRELLKQIIELDEAFESKGKVSLAEPEAE